jgi:hypothetical protein
VRLEAFSAERVAECCGSTVLPDDRRMDRLQRLAIPKERRLPLVRDADRCELGGLRLTLGERVGTCIDESGPPILGIVLHPPRAGKRLRELAIAATGDIAVLVNEQSGDASRPAIDREHLRHGAAAYSALPDRARPREQAG